MDDTNNSEEKQPFFGSALKQLRLDAGLSQAKLAERISDTFDDFTISQTYIAALEAKEHAPRTDVIEYLAKFFGVDESYFRGVDIKIARHADKKKKIIKLLNLYTEVYGASDQARFTRREIKQKIIDVMDELDALMEQDRIDFEHYQKRINKIMNED